MPQAPDYSPFIINPATFPGIDKAAAFAERNREKQDQELKQNRLSNLKDIYDQTDFQNAQLGQRQLDDYAQSELNNIRNKALTEYSGLDPAEERYRLSRDMQDFLQWHSAAKDTLANVKAGMQDLNKTLPNIDLQAAQGKVYNNLAQDFLTQDSNGKIIRKPVDLIPQKDYVSELYNPLTLAQITNDVSPAQKYYQTGTRQDIHGSDFTSIAGVKNREKWSGIMFPDKQVVVADVNGNPILDVKSETVPAVTKNGQPLKVIDTNQYQQIIGNPSVLASFMRKWVQDPSAEGYQNMRAALQSPTGDPSKDPAMETAFKHWLYLDAKNNLPMTLNKDQAQVTPAPKVTINNSGSKEPVIHDVYGEVDSEIPKDLLAEKPLSELSAGGDVIMSDVHRRGFKVDSPQDVVLYRDNTGGVSARVKYDTGKIKQTSAGNEKVYATTEYPLYKTGINVSATPGVKNKSAEIKKEASKTKKDPLGLF